MGVQTIWLVVKFSFTSYKRSDWRLDLKSIVYHGNRNTMVMYSLHQMSQECKHIRRVVCDNILEQQQNITVQVCALNVRMQINQ